MSAATDQDQKKERPLINMKSILGAIIALNCTFGAAQLASAHTSAAVVDTISGTASWYGPNFHGRKTANGETFNMNDLTAAHPSLPFGTKVRVTNQANGEAVTVRINDRGPFAGNREIDLSRQAAQEIGLISSGVGEVRIEVLANA